MEEIAERAMPGVVQIVTYDATGSAVWDGSGFFISPCEVVTNQHVIDGAYSVEVISDNGYYDRVTILNADADSDLAILRVDAEDEVPLQINPNADFKPGQKVIVIGYPLGFEKTLSDGLISALPTADSIQEIQITAPISTGSSGGPVLDEEGRVIGVVYALIDEGQNLNFAIGSETLGKFLALEDSPRQLPVAGSYVLWRVVARWVMRAAIAIVLAAVGGCMMMLAAIGMARLWQVLCWLWKSGRRLLTRPIRRYLRPTGLAIPQTWKFLRSRGYYQAFKHGLIGAVLVITGGWLFSAGVNSATNSAASLEATNVRLAPAVAKDLQSVTVYVTRTGTKYHRAGCRYLGKSKIPIPLEEAKRHYGPCSVCQPTE